MKEKYKRFWTNLFHSLVWRDPRYTSIEKKQLASWRWRGRAKNNVVFTRHNTKDKSNRTWVIHDNK